MFIAAVLGNSAIVLGTPFKRNDKSEFPLHENE